MDKVWFIRVSIHQANTLKSMNMILGTGMTKALTNAFGDLNGPEISPDLKTIVFTRYSNDPNHPTLGSWIAMEEIFGRFPISQHGIQPGLRMGHRFFLLQIKMAWINFILIDVDGSDLRKVSDLPALRGRSDWSPQNLIVTYSGDPWKREMYIMNSDGSDQHQISPSGGNSQGPSFSPDGQWIAFTAYFDKFNDINGCEIYIMRIDGTDLRRLTNNDYCDYQPRWGP